MTKSERWTKENNKRMHNAVIQRCIEECLEEIKRLKKKIKK